MLSALIAAESGSAAAAWWAPGQGTPLPAYGHGDLNDSLQPADPRLAAQMVSTWTTVLLVQSLRSLAAGLRACTGANTADRAEEAAALADEAAGMADAAHEALASDLLVDGVLPGYVVLEGEHREPLVHPRDTRTGLTYGVLPWIHAISSRPACTMPLSGAQTHSTSVM